MSQQNKLKINETKAKNKMMKKFTILVFGLLVSSIGSGLTDFGLAIYVLAMTKSVTATAIVSIYAFLPSILLAPVGGVYGLKSIKTLEEEDAKNEIINESCS